MKTDLADVHQSMCLIDAGFCESFKAAAVLKNLHIADSKILKTYT